MKTYIQAQGFQVWQSIVDGYTAPTVPPTNDKAVKLGENNSKAKNALLNGLSDTVFTKVAHCMLEDWLLSLMSTLVMGFGPQD
jgi:hypothetical protein